MSATPGAFMSRRSRHRLSFCKKLLGEKDDGKHENDDEKHGAGVENDPAARSYLVVLKQADNDALFWVKSVFDGLR